MKFRSLIRRGRKEERNGGEKLERRDKEKVRAEKVDVSVGREEDESEHVEKELESIEIKSKDAHCVFLPWLS